MKFTDESYDAMMEKFDAITDVPIYLPTKEEIEGFEADPDKYIVWCIYIYDRLPAMKDLTPAEKQRKLRLQDFISKHLEFVDEGDEDAD